MKLFPALTIFKTIGKSPGFWIKISRFRTGANSPEIFTKNPQVATLEMHLQACKCTRGLRKFGVIHGLYCQQQYTGNKLRHRLNPVLSCSNSTHHNLYCQQQYTVNPLRHKLNQVLLQKQPLLPATIHSEHTERQAESSTAAETTSTASNNTQGTH